MLPGETILSGAERVPGLSEFHVMTSPAGFYIGTTAPDPECGGMVTPYSRESIYFATEEEATEALKTWTGDNPLYLCARS